MKNAGLSPAQLEQEVTVTLPLKAVLQLASDSQQLVALAEDVSFARGVSFAREERHTPAIGAEWEGGRFAGITLEGDRLAALVLLPGDFSGTWAEAKDWADKEDGVLPSRIDQLVLLKNLKDEFRTDSYYWSSDEVAGDPEDAWDQNFADGYQNYWHKSSKTRARAVRRVPI